MSIPLRSKVALETLLSTIEQRECFIRICIISTIENFAFMFHYVDYPIDKFKIKTSKYLARIAHACFLRKELLKQTDNKIILEKILTKTNLGCCNSIIKKFKKNNKVKNSELTGFNKEFYKIFDKKSFKESIELLEEIYKTLVNAENDFGINESDMILTLA